VCVLCVCVCVKEGQREGEEIEIFQQKEQDEIYAITTSNNFQQKNAKYS